MRRGAHVKKVEKKEYLSTEDTIEAGGRSLSFWHRKHVFGFASHIEDLPLRRPDSGRLGESQAWGCVLILQCNAVW